MTGYHLSVGYQSGAGDAEAWQALKEVVAELCRSRGRLVREAEGFNTSHDVAMECFQSYESFNGHRTEDSTLKIIEPEGDEKGQVMQLASGGGEWRLHKEAMRRAFCRLAIADMHYRGYEVNLTVA